MSAGRRLPLLLGLAAFLAASPAALARPPRPAPLPPLPWTARGDIELNDVLREKIGALATLYRAKTKRSLEVTSGHRPPARQAAAMYVKLATGGSLAIYKNQALVEPLRKAYREGRKKRWKKERIVAAMAAVLEDQVARGIYLSRHMRGLAFDVRSAGMSTRQRAALKQAVAEVGGMRIIYESKPPHFHVELLQPTSDDSGVRDDIDDEEQLPHE